MNLRRRETRRDSVHIAAFTKFCSGPTRTSRYPSLFTRSGRGNVSRSAPRDVDRLGYRSWRAARDGACAPRMRFKDLERGVRIISICELEYSPADTLTLYQRIPGSMATAAFTATVETLTEDNLPLAGSTQSPFRQQEILLWSQPFAKLQKSRNDR
jgi:hypothetical protein